MFSKNVPFLNILSPIRVRNDASGVAYSIHSIIKLQMKIEFPI